MVHRDDIDFDVLERLQEAFPGYRIVCMGDMPEEDIPERVKEAAAALDARYAESLANGLCIDCSKQFPNWPPADGDPIPDGWFVFTDTSGEPKAFQCPECDAKEGEG